MRDAAAERVLTCSPYAMPYVLYRYAVRDKGLAVDGFFWRRSAAAGARLVRQLLLRARIPAAAKVTPC